MQGRCGRSVWARAVQRVDNSRKLHGSKARRSLDKYRLGHEVQKGCLRTGVRWVPDLFVRKASHNCHIPLGSRPRGALYGRANHRAFDRSHAHRGVDKGRFADDGLLMAERREGKLAVVLAHARFANAAKRKARDPDMDNCACDRSTEHAGSDACVYDVERCPHAPARSIDSRRSCARAHADRHVHVQVSLTQAPPEVVWLRTRVVVASSWQKT